MTNSIYKLCVRVVTACAVLVFSLALSGPSVAAEPVANACPEDGCLIRIISVAKAGDELEVKWEANFLPDVSRNHIHIYWDTYTAEEVSSDAESNGFKQGDWVPTADYPVFVSSGAMSVANRAESTTICVTASGRDHAVLDPTAVHCISAADSL